MSNNQDPRVDVILMQELRDLMKLCEMATTLFQLGESITMGNMENASHLARRLESSSTELEIPELMGAAETLLADILEATNHVDGAMEQDDVNNNGDNDDDEIMMRVKNNLEHTIPLYRRILGGIALAGEMP